MQQAEITPRDFLIWWQNRFPNFACIAAPYARTQIKQSLQSESYFTLKVAYLISRLNEYDPNVTNNSEQLNWLPSDSRKELLEDLASLGMDALVKHLRENPFSVIPNQTCDSVTNALNSRLNEFFEIHRASLIQNMESATGQVIDKLPKQIRLSANASEVVELLSLPYVIKFMEFIEKLDGELTSLKELFLTPAIQVDPLTKRRFRDFRIDVDRHLKSFDMQIPEVAEEWLYQVFELIEKYPNYFGK